MLCENAVAKAPLKVSPAAVVSMASTFSASICAISSSDIKKKTPFDPIVIITFLIPLSSNFLAANLDLSMSVISISVRYLVSVMLGVIV